jgi:D-serine deaminase-like pyridoxal phosphate-dependent protein
MNIEELDTPASVVDLDILESNIARLAQLSRSSKITIAVDSLVAAHSLVAVHSLVALQGLSTAAAAAGTTLHRLAEFDSGMRRCGVQSPERIECLVGCTLADPNSSSTPCRRKHGHLDLPVGLPPPRLGQKLSVIPNHARACVNMRQRLHYHGNGTVEGCCDVAAREAVG